MNGNLVIRVVQALLLGIFFLSIPVNISQAKSEDLLLLGEHRQQILQATLQISVSLTLTQPVGKNRVKEIQMIGFGLGSLIDKDGSVFIVTHNHWGEPLQAESRVEFRDAKKSLLMSLSGAQFEDLIRFEDAGTLVLDAPEELFTPRSKRLTPARLAVPKKDIGLLKPGDVVQVAYRTAENFQQVELLDAAVESISQLNGVPTINLRSLNGQSVTPGDSGGGIWFQGQLVANLWGRLLIEKAAKGGNSNQTQLVETDLCFSALFPVSR